MLGPIHLKGQGEGKPRGEALPSKKPKRIDENGAPGPIGRSVPRRRSN